MASARLARAITEEDSPPHLHTIKKKLSIPQFPYIAPRPACS